MNKSLKAFLRGYLLFDVNGTRFYLYNSAANCVMTLGDQRTVRFCGLHIFKGRRCFSLQIDCRPVVWGKA